MSENEVFHLAAGDYTAEELRQYVKEHGQLPPEIEETLVDRTDKVLQEAAEIRQREV